MHPVAYFFSALLGFVSTVIGIYMFIVLIAVIMHLLVQFRVVNLHNSVVYKIYEILNRLTEPALRPIRRRLPSFGGIDLSPLVLYLALLLLQTLIGSLQYSIGYYSVSSSPTEIAPIM